MKYRSPMLRQSELLQNGGVSTEEEVGWVGGWGRGGWQVSTGHSVRRFEARGRKKARVKLRLF